MLCRRCRECKYCIYYCIPFRSVNKENWKYYILVVLTVYGLDAIWTIIRRLNKRENIFKAHRSHLYQYLANENKTNKLIVSGIYGLIQLFIGGIVIWGTSLSVSAQLILSGSIIGFGSIVYFGIKQKLIKT